MPNIGVGWSLIALIFSMVVAIAYFYEIHAEARGWLVCLNGCMVQ